MVADQGSVLQKTYDLDEGAISKRDLRLKKVLDEQKGLTENREIIKMAPMEAKGFVTEHLIEDIRSSETMIIDNL